MKLLALLPYDERARRKHCLVFGFIVDWWHRDYGDALASSRFVASKLEERRHHILNGKGLSAPQAHVVMADLALWGFLVKVRGKGRWANRYVPNWSLVCSPTSEDVSATSCQGAISATSCQDDCVSPPGSTNGLCVSTSGSEDPFTRPGQRPRDGLNGNNNSHSALAGNAPPAFAAGVPEGARVPEAQSPFDEFWLNYPKKVKKAKARAAYEKLAPDAALHGRIISKAKELAAHHAEHGTEFRWIKEPANWLAGEGYDEDLPAVYCEPKAAAVAKRKASSRTDDRPANDNSFPESWRHAVEITDAGVVYREQGSFITLQLRGIGGELAGKKYDDEIAFESDDESALAEGRRCLDELCIATGVAEFEDTDVFLNTVVDIVWANDRFNYFVHKPRAEAA